MRDLEVLGQELCSRVAVLASYDDSCALVDDARQALGRHRNARLGSVCPDVRSLLPAPVPAELSCDSASRRSSKERVIGEGSQYEPSVVSTLEMELIVATELA